MLGTPQEDYQEFKNELIRRFFNAKSYFFYCVSQQLQHLPKHADLVEEQDYVLISSTMDHLSSAAQPFDELEILRELPRFSDFVDTLNGGLNRLQAPNLTPDAMKDEIRAMAIAFVEALIDILHESTQREQLLTRLDDGAKLSEDQAVQSHQNSDAAPVPETENQPDNKGTSPEEDSDSDPLPFSFEDDLVLEPEVSDIQEQEPEPGHASEQPAPAGQESENSAEGEGEELPFFFDEEPRLEDDETSETEQDSEVNPFSLEDDDAAATPAGAGDANLGIDAGLAEPETAEEQPGLTENQDPLLPQQDSDAAGLSPEEPSLEPEEEASQLDEISDEALVQPGPENLPAEGLEEASLIDAETESDHVPTVGSQDDASADSDEPESEITGPEEVAGEEARPPQSEALRAEVQESDAQQSDAEEEPDLLADLAAVPGFAEIDDGEVDLEEELAFIRDDQAESEEEAEDAGEDSFLEFETLEDESFTPPTEDEFVISLEDDEFADAFSPEADAAGMPGDAVAAEDSGNFSAGDQEFEIVEPDLPETAEHDSQAELPPATQDEPAGEFTADAGIASEPESQSGPEIESAVEPRSLEKQFLNEAEAIIANIRETTSALGAAKHTLNDLEKAYLELRETAMIHGFETLEELAFKTQRCIASLATRHLQPPGDWSDILSMVPDVLELACSEEIDREQHAQVRDCISALSRVSDDFSPVAAAGSVTAPPAAEESGKPNVAPQPVIEHEAEAAPESMSEAVAEAAPEKQDQEQSSAGDAEPKPVEVMSQQEQEQEIPLEQSVEPEEVAEPDQADLNENEATSELDLQDLIREVAGKKQQRPAPEAGTEILASFDAEEVAQAADESARFKRFRDESDLCFRLIFESIENLLRDGSNRLAMENLELAAYSLKGFATKMQLEPLARYPDLVEELMTKALLLRVSIDEKPLKYLARGFNFLLRIADTQGGGMQTLRDMERTVMRFIRSLNEVTSHKGQAATELLAAPGASGSGAVDVVVAAPRNRHLQLRRQEDNKPPASQQSKPVTKLPDDAFSE